MFTCSLTGEKLKPLVIGHSENPRAFRGFDKEQLPVMWRSSKKAWMTGPLFTEWLEHLNRRMKLHKRKILLFMDNVSSHGGASILNLSNVTCKFLPANTTSCLQPLDAGIIQMFKLHFRKQLLTHVIVRIDGCSSATEVTKSVTVLNAITWIDKAWKAVQPMTVTKCFLACGFPQLPESDSQADDGELHEITHGIEDVQDLLTSATTSGMEVVMDAREYIQFDKDIPTENPTDWEKDIVEHYKEVHQVTEEASCNSIEENEEGENTPESDDTPCPLDYKDALSLLSQLHWFAAEKDVDLLPDINKITEHVEQKILEKRRENRQTLITDFFTS